MEDSQIKELFTSIGLDATTVANTMKSKKKTGIFLSFLVVRLFSSSLPSRPYYRYQWGRSSERLWKDHW